MAACLAMVAGFVDAYGAIAYNTYLSFMSGNTTQTGYRVGEGDFALAFPSGLAILFFVIGSFAGHWLAHAAVRRKRQVVFGVVIVALVSIIAMTGLGLAASGAHIASTSFAMGVMNTALSRVGAEAVSLTFVTGTLSRLGMHLALAVRRVPLVDSQGPWDTQTHRAAALAGLWTAFFAGAVASGAATPRFGAWVLLFPILVVSALTALDRETRPAA